MQIHVNDLVTWTPEWGLGLRQIEPRKVVNIECDGVPVEAIDLDHDPQEEVFIDLDNGRWAYAYQLQPLAVTTDGRGLA